MRRIPLFKIALASLLTAVVLTGCGSSGNPAGPGPSGGGTGSGNGNGNNGGGTFGGTMTATLDGVAWTASVVTANSGSGLIAVGASDDSGMGFGFNFYETGPGTYPVVFPDPTAMNANLSTDAGIWSAGGNVGSGELVVTTLTATRIAGTFSFTLDGAGLTPAQRTMTNGQFDVNF